MRIWTPCLLRSGRKYYSFYVKIIPVNKLDFIRYKPLPYLVLATPRWCQKYYSVKLIFGHVRIV